MSRYWDNDYYAQPTDAELRRNVNSTAVNAAKKGQSFNPVVVKAQGRKLAENWWGQAWCANLERYADFSSRIARGKRYVRAGTVVDLQIKKGIIHARVQGSRRTPYRVEIRISPIDEEKCQKIIERSTVKFSNIEQLVQGNFPEEMKDLFGGEGGLFPTSREISFACSCPDWALMCKHVAAALYGIGVMFDENPLLFFELRGIDINRFIDVSLKTRVEKMLENAGNIKSPRIVDDMDIAQEYFGVKNSLK